MQFQSFASKSLQPSLILPPIVIKTLNHDSRPLCSISPSLAQCPNYIMHNWPISHDTGSQLCLIYLAQGGITQQAPKTYTILHTIQSIIHAVTITVSPVISTYLPPQYTVSETKPLHKYSLTYPGGEGGVFGGFKPPRNSEVLKKLGQIPSFVEYTSVTT
jgi:hypothetical protein